MALLSPEFFPFKTGFRFDRCFGFKILMIIFLPMKFFEQMKKIQGKNYMEATGCQNTNYTPMSLSFNEKDNNYPVFKRQNIQITLDPIKIK